MSRFFVKISLFVPFLSGYSYWEKDFIRAKAGEASIVRFPNPRLKVPSQLGNLAKADAAYGQAPILQIFKVAKHASLQLFLLSPFSEEDQWGGGHLGVEALLEGAEKISEEVGVGVLAQLVQHEPVPQVAVAEHLGWSFQVKRSKGDSLMFCISYILK